MRRRMENMTIRELDLIEFAAYLLKRMNWIVAAAFTGMLAAAFCAFVLIQPVYEATAQLYIANTESSMPSLSELQSASYLAENCRSILQTWEVSQKVAENLHLPYSASELKGMMAVTNPDKTGVLCITVSSDTPDSAMHLANAFAEVGRMHIAERMKVQAPSVLSAAVKPSAPVGPNKIMILLSGMAIGTVLAVWGLFVIYSRDDRVRNAQDVFECLGEYPLAVITIPEARGKNTRKGS